MKTQMSFLAALLIAGACTSQAANPGPVLGSTTAGQAALPGAAGVTGTVPVAGTAAVGTNVGAQGTAGTAVAGTAAPSSGVAGVAAPAAGIGGPVAAAGSAASGTGALGAGAGVPSAGTSAVVAGAGTAGFGGAAAAGSGTAGAGSAGSAGSMGAAGSSGSAAGMVTVKFTTVSYGGQYAPLNYGAVWFEDSTGKFIKTAKRWAGAAHATDLVAWTAASGGWGSFFGGGNQADQMDAVSQATIRMHQSHTVTWNMKDVQMQLVADGDYVAVLEMSESRALDRAGPLLRIKFTKGPMPQTVAVPDDPSFTGVSLDYTP